MGNISTILDDTESFISGRRPNRYKRMGTKPSVFLVQPPAEEEAEEEAEEIPESAYILEPILDTLPSYLAIYAKILYPDTTHTYNQIYNIDVIEDSIESTGLPIDIPTDTSPSH